jgi:ATP-dependent Clp protease ATP-binding subunit ClpX
MSEESLICSFCGKSRKDVTKMIVGTRKTSICNECVKLCVEILEEDIVKARKEQLYAGDKEILNPVLIKMPRKLYYQLQLQIIIKELYNRLLTSN